MAAAAAAASAGMRVDTRQASAEALPGLTSALNSGRSRVSGWVWGVSFLYRKYEKNKIPGCSKKSREATLDLV